MLRNSRRKDKTKKDLKDAQEEGRIPEVDPFVALDRKLHGIDEEKCQDCKDDMDTLLVFAGLYSAVLTSFLVQSYQNLLESPQQTSNDLLRQIASQTNSYMLVNGQLNSTASSTPPPPFQVAIADIRINVCWFASLILSLSTASFGILVKQWLREYLAIGSTVPEERIRIRHFRKRGLEDWKLFEIAAALPFVLQLSLALFFVGLCFFTAEIHPSLRATSLMLVSGWALLFSFTFLAPLVSARCPYKTTFLKTVFQHVRPYIHTLITEYFVYLLLPVSILRLLSLQAYTGIRRLYQWIRNCLGDMVAKLLGGMSCVQHIPTSWAPREPEYDEQGHLRSNPYNSASQLHNVPGFIMRVFDRYQLSKDMVVIEEETARTSEDNDLIIWKEVDDILRDDGVLAIMRGACQWKPRPCYEVLCLVVSMLRSRLGIQTLKHDDIPFQQLSPWTCLTFMNILHDTLQGRNGNENFNTIISLLILLGKEKRYMLDDMSAILTPILSGRGSVDFICKGVLAAGETTGDWQGHVFAVLADAFRTLDPSVLRSVVHRAYIAPADEDPTFQSNTYGRLLGLAMRTIEHDASLEAHQRVSIGVLEALSNLTMSILQDMVDATPQPLNEQNVRHIKELLPFFLKATYIIIFTGSWEDVWVVDNRRKLLKSFFTMPGLFPILLECVGAEQESMLGDSVLYTLYLRSASEAVPALLKTEDGITHILSAIVDYFQGKQNAQPPLKLYNTLSLYLVHLYLLRSAKAEHQTLYKQMSSLVTECLKKASSAPTAPSSLSSSLPVPLDEQQPVSRLAYRILYGIDNHPEDGMSSPADVVQHYHPFSSFHPEHVAQEIARYYQWKAQFDIHRSMYSDELITLLRSLADDVTDDCSRTFWRIRRLDDLEERSEALGGREIDAGVVVGTATEAGEGSKGGTEAPRTASLGDEPLAASLEDTSSQNVRNTAEEASGVHDSRVAGSDPAARGEPVLPEEIPTSIAVTE
ncbi:hypothetical protein NM688_g5235 [Phlebia brevispora]|uniref:Uncharacterized protein n=1 Tax=Phlebia brevispora TaxID=194682 RepID=A0ACC1SYE4_9APHY|nr:hypothetical protein NM688_g5235 [Phlebia brevispora]